MSEVDFEPQTQQQQKTRLFIPNLLSSQECKELEFIHKCSSTVGYRPNVFSTTLSHLIATNSSHFIIPFIPIRERLKDKLEEFFKCEFELFIEFTGLISWSRGASIGWHSDDNRPYLKQRHFSVVCYLNTYGKDFNGGLFHFQDGEPETIMPAAGDVVMYTADERNIHSVDEITDGERLTLALWFSRDGSHDEDTKLVSLLSQHLLNKNIAGSLLPLPASSNMYWFSQDQASNDKFGFNICWARLHILGYNIYISHDSGCDSDVSELMVQPVRLVRASELLDHEFVNILHALQVVQFYHWKGSAVQTNMLNIDYKVVNLLDEQRERIRGLNSVLLNDGDFAPKIFGGRPSDSEETRCITFNWTGIVAAIAGWEDYVLKLSKQVNLQLPYWRAQESLYNVQLEA
ncbi:procollagen-proline 3-dioxygenase [Trifolium repens]|nr:procollagen-proline 3-dioxygenase [Trifolium repens]